MAAKRNTVVKAGTAEKRTTSARRKIPVARGGREYAVRYGLPPRHSQFKPGHSGNPWGRPKGSRNKIPARNEPTFDELIRQEVYRPITVNDGGRQVTMPVAKAFLRTLGMNALQGRSRAQKLLADLLAGTEGRNRAKHETTWSR